MSIQIKKEPVVTAKGPVAIAIVYKPYEDQRIYWECAGEDRRQISSRKLPLANL
jgi:hypothetical protein